MSLNIEKIESFGGESRNKAKSKKWRKNQRNRKIRCVPYDEIPHIKNKGWEY